MVVHRCGHRRIGVVAELAARPLVLGPFVAALVVCALGYGVMAGVAHGHADATRMHAVAESCTVPSDVG